MSMFLPDGQSQAPAPFGVADSTPSEPETTSGDIALMQRVLAAASRNPNLIPADFMAYVLDWIQTQRLQIPIGQVFGFSGFTANVAPFIASDETTTSVSYTDLATVGPELDGLSDGSYLLLYGALAVSSTSGVGCDMSVSVNGTAADDADKAYAELTQFSQVMTARTKVLSNNGGNSIVAKYRIGSGGSTARFTDRWLIAIKYAN